MQRVNLRCRLRLLLGKKIQAHWSPRQRGFLGLYFGHRNLPKVVDHRASRRIREAEEGGAWSARRTREAEEGGAWSARRTREEEEEEEEEGAWSARRTREEEGEEYRFREEEEDFVSGFPLWILIYLPLNLHLPGRIREAEGAEGCGCREAGEGVDRSWSAPPV